MNSQDILVHHARSSALSANLSGTNLKPILTQSSIALPSIGGEGLSSAGKLQHSFITFGSAQSEVSGELVSKNPKIYVTQAKTTIQGLDIQGIIQAESIIARVVVTTIMRNMKGLGPEPEFSFADTSFQGLVIDGKSYSLETSDFDMVLSRMQDLYARSKTGVRLTTTLSDDPVALHPRASTLNRELLATKGTIEEKDLQQSEIQAIRVPKFGDVSIAEVLYNPYICQVHMLRVEVDFELNNEKIIGEITIGAVEGGASCYPGHRT